jgi:hypothetical protein
LPSRNRRWKSSLSIKEAWGFGGDKGEPVMVDGYAKCKNCDGLIQMSSTIPVSFWQHVETSSVWCGPGGKPVGMGDRRKASPV